MGMRQQHVQAFINVAWRPTRREARHSAAGNALKPNMQVIADRISTQEELDEVISLLVKFEQLPIDTALELLESSNAPARTSGGVELWLDIDDHRLGAEIESLSNFILGRTLMLN
jgi:hypothetical protein